MALGAFWIGHNLIFYLIRGNRDENDYSSDGYQERL